MSRYERNNPDFNEGYDQNNMGASSNRSRMGYSDQDAGEMQPRGNGNRKYSNQDAGEMQPRGNGNRNQRGYGNQRSDDYQQRSDRNNGGRSGSDDKRGEQYGDHDGGNQDGDHDGDHSDHGDKKHGTSGGHKAVNIILIIIIILLVVAIVFCILYLTNAWKPSFMKTIFGDNEKFTHKPKASSCATGVCGYGDKLTDDEKEKRKRKRRSRKIKE